MKILDFQPEEQRKAQALEGRKPRTNIRSTYNARIAQSVEQRIENPRVGGSIPSPGTISTSK